MSLEKALADHAVALNANTEQIRVLCSNQERLLAGQAAAIDRIDGAGKKDKKDKPDAKGGDVKPKPAAAEVSDADVKNAALAWMKDKDDAAKKVAGAFLGDLLTHFGVGGKLTGPDSKLNADQRKQAKFYIERKAAGLPVDLNAEYDFDGDPKQGAAAAEPVEEDPLG